MTPRGWKMVWGRIGHRFLHRCGNPALRREHCHHQQRPPTRSPEHRLGLGPLMTGRNGNDFINLRRYHLVQQRHHQWRYTHLWFDPIQRNIGLWIMGMITILCHCWIVHHRSLDEGAARSALVDDCRGQHSFWFWTFYTIPWLLICRRVCRPTCGGAAKQDPVAIIKDQFRRQYVGRHLSQ